MVAHGDDSRRREPRHVFRLRSTARHNTIRSGPDNVQWFDAFAYSYQINRESSFAIGLRSVTGDPPQPNGGGDCIGKCTNVSVAYHLRLTTKKSTSPTATPTR